MANKSWHNIGYHNYRDQDWKGKFMHHERKGGGNLWGYGSQLFNEGFLVPKSKYASRGHGNKKNKYDKRWKWNPEKNLSMQDKWKLYGRITGKGKASEGYVNFRLKDIDRGSHDNVNWNTQFTNRGWKNAVNQLTDYKFDGSNKEELWGLYKQWDQMGGAPVVAPPAPEPDPPGDPGDPDAPGGGDPDMPEVPVVTPTPPIDEQIDTPSGNIEVADVGQISGTGDQAGTDINIPWSPRPGAYTTKGIRRGLFAGRGDRSGSNSPTGFFSRRGRRLRKQLQIGGVNTSQAGALNV